jgi:hypothetical protein
MIIPAIGVVIPFIHMVLSIIPTSATALFCILARIIADNFKILQKHSQDLRLEWSVLTKSQIALRLRRWKFSYIKVFEAVELLNSLFGIIFLLQMTYISISFVINSFLLTSKQFHSRSLGFKSDRIVFFIKNLINTLALCVMSEIITREVK